MSTLNNIGVVMFTVSDIDDALAFYTDKLGFEVRSDQAFGPEDEYRWLEIAPPGSTARVALNLPRGDAAGGGCIGVETPDVPGEHARLSALDGVTVGDLMQMPGTPAMFDVRDPDGNAIWVVDAP